MLAAAHSASPVQAQTARTKTRKTRKRESEKNEDLCIFLVFSCINAKTRKREKTRKTRKNENQVLRLCLTAPARRPPQAKPDAFEKMPTHNLSTDSRFFSFFSFFLVFSFLHFYRKTQGKSQILVFSRFLVFSFFLVFLVFARAVWAWTGLAEWAMAGTSRRSSPSVAPVWLRFPPTKNSKALLRHYFNKPGGVDKHGILDASAYQHCSSSAGGCQSGWVRCAAHYMDALACLGKHLSTGSMLQHILIFTKTGC